MHRRLERAVKWMSPKGEYNFGAQYSQGHPYTERRYGKNERLNCDISQNPLSAVGTSRLNTQITKVSILTTVMPIPRNKN